jgi:hypothetical protein
LKKTKPSKPAHLAPTASRYGDAFGAFRSGCAGSNFGPREERLAPEPYGEPKLVSYREPAPLNPPGANAGADALMLCAARAKGAPRGSPATECPYARGDGLR